MQRLSDHYVEFGVLLALFLIVMASGFWAARWRSPTTMYSLDEWGLGGRSFGPVLSWFLITGNLYTAYTFVAVPAALYAIGAAGFFAVPFAAITPPLVYVALIRMWSVSHVHGLVTPADFVRIRFDSRALAMLVAVAGIVASMPYVALQLVGIEAVFKVIGLNGPWPLWAAFGILALFTFNAGLRAPALISIIKDVLFLWVILAALVFVAASYGGWGKVFEAADARFTATPNPADGLLLPQLGQFNFGTLVLGSALALFLYPHAVTAVLAAKNRGSVRVALAAVPIYTFGLGILALLGYVAIFRRVLPVGADPTRGVPGDLNTVLPRLFGDHFPDWVAGTAFAAIIFGAFVPAAILSIGAANLFTRNIYLAYLRPNASPAEQTRVSRFGSLGVKFGAIAFIIFLEPQLALDLQLIGGVIILQTLPAVGLGLFTSWLHRRALLLGMTAGLVTGIVLLYQIPRLGPGGTVLRAHFGGSAWPLSHLGIEGGHTVYTGLAALVVNIVVAFVATPLVRFAGLRDGYDITWRRDYAADEGDPQIRRLDEILDGQPVHDSTTTEVPASHALLNARTAEHPYVDQRWPTQGNHAQINLPISGRFPDRPY